MVDLDPARRPLPPDTGENVQDVGNTHILPRTDRACWKRAVASSAFLATCFAPVLASDLRRISQPDPGQHFHWDFPPCQRRCGLCEQPRITVRMQQCAVIPEGPAAAPPRCARNRARTRPGPSQMGPAGELWATSWLKPRPGQGGLRSGLVRSHKVAKVQGASSAPFLCHLCRR